MLHRYKARDMAQFLDIFERDVLDDEGESLGIKKSEDLFFEKIVGILPMFIKDMNDFEVIRSLEVLTKKNLGS
jgi:hypothetical protein